MFTHRVLLPGLIAAIGCSSGGAASTSGATTGSTASAAARRGSATLITQQEIAAAGAGMENAFDIVERLRPSMMRSRASTFGTPRSDGTQAGASINVLAYVDEIRLGELSNLRTVPATQILEIRYISATDATQRWGTGHGSGVIQVVTRK
ncbi:MAG: hypothetical protein ACT4P7_18795 [Gemmatimonadaceae bacterium]